MKSNIVHPLVDYTPLYTTAPPEGWTEGNT